jgi:hypothetical protein
MPHADMHAVWFALRPLILKAPHVIRRVSDFFASPPCEGGDLLLVQCDPQAASLRRIEHAKFLIENARAKHERQRKVRV